MIVLRGWFELGQISEPRDNEADNGCDRDDDHHDDARHYLKLLFSQRCVYVLRPDRGAGHGALVLVSAADEKMPRHGGGKSVGGPSYCETYGRQA